MIQQLPDTSWGRMPITRVITTIDQSALLLYLYNLRAEWANAVDDMASVTINLDLLFDDLIEFAKTGKG